MSNLRNIPIQARSNNRLHSIQVAALEHLQEVGRDGFNTATVAERAGCSIGTLYRYWKNGAALLDSIWPDRDVVLTRVAEILSEPLPVVTASREQDRAALMQRALDEMELSEPMLPEDRALLVKQIRGE
jgi:AcrR family transcriptional regulator